MKLLAPSYYKNFKCIADKCKHSCCIGWEIDIDDDTLDLYADIEEPYGEVIRDSVDFDDVPHFRLTDEERCPHLDSAGLCKIITEFGEDHLCDICTDHPRFYEDTKKGKTVGIGMSCEEACRIILTSEDYRIVEIDELEDDDQYSVKNDFDSIEYIEDLYKKLSTDGSSLKEKISKIIDINTVHISKNSWIEILDKLEFLNESSRSAFENFDTDISVLPEFEKKLERALAYFIFRHCSGAKTIAEFNIALGFGCICTFLIASIVKHQNKADINEATRTVSEEIEYSETNTEILKNIIRI